MCQFSCQAEIIPFTRRRTGGEDILYYTLFFLNMFFSGGFPSKPIHAYIAQLESHRRRSGQGPLSPIITHARTHTHVHTRARVRTHVRASASTHTRTLTHAHARTHTHTPVYTHTRARAYMHAYARTLTHAHTHAHTRVRVSYRVGSSFDPVSVMYFCLQKSRLPTGLGV